MLHKFYQQHLYRKAISKVTLFIAKMSLPQCKHVGVYLMQTMVLVSSESLCSGAAAANKFLEENEQSFSLQKNFN
jgi:hypothetical protein